MMTLGLVPTPVGWMYKCLDCEAQFLPAIADFHKCPEVEEEE
jgi:DNA-directed RNA polymerase subunit RPC12/RpoP